MARSMFSVESYFYTRRDRELGLKTTTTTGCALVNHLFSDKLVGQRWRIASTSQRLLDRVTLSCQGEHHHHEAWNSYHTVVCRALQEKTSGEEAFAFIAAAAGAGNDDHQMEVVVRETGEPATKNREVILSRSRQSQMSPRKSWHFSNDTCSACIAAADSVPTRHWFALCGGKEPCHSSSDLHEILSVHHVEKFEINVLTQWQVSMPFLPSGKTYRSTEHSGVIQQTA